MKTVQPPPHKKDLKKFGMIMRCLFPIMFGLVITWIWSLQIPFWPFYAGALFLMLAFLVPNVLRPVYFLWILLGKGLGRINYFVIMTAIFVFIFTPVGIFFRLTGKDPLQRVWNKKKQSYRQTSLDQESSHMEKPY